MLILNQQDLRGLLRMRDVVEAVEEGFRVIARGEAVVPDRLHLGIPDTHAVVLEMPAYARSISLTNTQSALGTKIVSVFPTNRSLNLNIVQSVYILLDAETGVPLALMDGRFITAIRTAATSAVATRYLATSGPKRLAVLGAGVQAQFHIEAMLEVAEVERIMIASRTEASARELADRTRSLLNIPTDIVTPEEAASEANLICACTTSSAPLFDGRVLTPGTHINAVGAFTPTTRELDSEAVRRSRVIIDAESAAGREAGEVLIPISEGAFNVTHIKGTLSDVVSGKVPGRTSSDEITLFKSCGLAIEDLVTAHFAYNRATESSVGHRVEI